MAPLSQHQSSKITKLLLIGDSGSGKTGSLTSLVKDGYRLRILDFDMGVETLVQYVRKECPENLDNVDSIALRDKVKATEGLGFILDGPPKAFITATRLVDRWKYKNPDGSETDLGKPNEWGPESILVLDSLSFMSDAAMFYAEPLTVRGKDGKTDSRMIYFQAQQAIESFIGYITSESFATNVIVTAHIRYTAMPDGSLKGQPNAAGSALGPIIPRYFNSVALCQSDQGGKRSIKTVSSGLIDLKNPAPFKMAPAMPIDTAMADFFQTLRSK